MIPNIVTNLLRPDGVFIAPFSPVTKSMHTYVPSIMFQNNHFDHQDDDEHEHHYQQQKYITSKSIGDVIEKCNFHSILQYTESVTMTSGTKTYNNPTRQQYHHTSKKRRHSQPYQFIIAKKDISLLSYRMSTEAETMLAIRKAELVYNDVDDYIKNNNEYNHNDYKDKNIPYIHFDAATMQTYEFPSRIMEDMWCIDVYSTMNETDHCFQYQTFDPSIPVIPSSAFEVRTSTVANGGRGVFSINNVPKDTYIGLKDMVQGMFVPPVAYALLTTTALNVVDYTPYFDCLLDGYLNGYGWVESVYVSFFALIQ